MSKEEDKTKKDDFKDKDEIIQFSISSYKDLEQLKNSEKILFEDGPRKGEIAAISVLLSFGKLKVNVFRNNINHVDCIASEENNPDYLLETIFTSAGDIIDVDEVIVSDSKKIFKNKKYCIYKLVNDKYFIDGTRINNI